MDGPPRDQFSAAASALGFVYQLEVALLGYLQRDDQAIDVAIEVADDVSYGGPEGAQVQVKLHLGPASLSDGSRDLWKTIRVWATQADSDAQLVLFTTAQAPAESIAALLRLDGQRNVKRATARLVSRAEAGGGEVVTAGHTAFLALDEAARLELVRRIVVADDAPSPLDLDGELRRLLARTTRPERLGALVQRLREWWLARATRHLVAVAHKDNRPIPGAEIEEQIFNLQEQLGPEALPLGYEALPAPTDEELDAEQRVFVHQLRLIMLHHRRIRKAVHDHNRAYAERSRWVREDLLTQGELERYDERLVDEWDRLAAPLSDEDEPELSEADGRRLGRELHQACDQAVLPPIRPRVVAAYIQRGSMQMLAEDKRIGWHPNWLARLQALLAEPAA